MLLVSFLVSGCATRSETYVQESTRLETGALPLLVGEYIGQSPPGSDPEIFAPGVVSTGRYERDFAITPDGHEIYYTTVIGNYAYTTIMVVQLVDGRWVGPEVAPFADDPNYMHLEPFISPDGKRFYFVTNRPWEMGGEIRETDIWVMDRQGLVWGDPRPLPPPVNTEAAEYFPSVTREGTIYFTREPGDGSSFIYRARPAGEEYTQLEKLGPEVNSTSNQFNAFIAPDESYLIVPVYGREDSRGSTDYYICYRDENDIWAGPINLGAAVNTEGGVEYSPYVTRDGKYFFFMSSRPVAGETDPPNPLHFEWIERVHNEPGNGSADIWWMEAGFIEALRP